MSDLELLVEGTDYRLLPYSDDVWSVLFLDGRYKDTIVLYGDVSITENPDDPDAGELNFEIELIENPMDLDIEHEGFKQYCGDVLVSIDRKSVV